MGASGELTLVALALLARLSGAAVRTGVVPLARFIGWLLCAVGAWLAVGAGGAFSPLGLALLAGLGLALVDVAERRRPLWLAGDVLVVVLCGVTSLPAIPGVVVLIVAAATAAGGAAVDRLAQGLGGPARTVAALLPLLLWGGYGTVAPHARSRFLAHEWRDAKASLGVSMAVASAPFGERIELESGAVAWFTHPDSPPPWRPALFFHGSDEDGANQRGGLFIRQALVSIGYAVMAVDAPGFGESPNPRPVGVVEAWDPLPDSLAGARHLSRRSDVGGSIVVVGHSMGATRVLRFLDAWPGASAGVVMGATVMPPAHENDAFYQAFLEDYEIESEEVTPDFVLEVRRRYFNNDRATARLPEGHAPILFVRFANDYENIIRGREHLFAMIPGRALQWELHSDHQFASGRIGGVLTGSWRIMSDLRRGLRRFMEGRDPVTGRPLPYAPR